MFECKQEAPSQFVFSRYNLPQVLPPTRLAQRGRVLAYWMDAGWGDLIKENKGNGCFCKELVDAMAGMIAYDWIPWPLSIMLGWVTSVPSTRHVSLVPNFAINLAKQLRLPFSAAVIKVDDHAPQKSQKNNYHRCSNLDGTFQVREELVIRGCPVLLVDDIVRSTWTVTVIAALLQEAGSGPVFPCGLARIVSED